MHTGKGLYVWAIIEDEGGNVIAKLNRSDYDTWEQAEAQAKLIVDAVNNYEQLLNQLKTAVFLFDRDQPQGSIGEGWADKTKELLNLNGVAAL